MGNPLWHWPRSKNDNILMLVVLFEPFVTVITPNELLPARYIRLLVISKYSPVWQGCFVYAAELCIRRWKINRHASNSKVFEAGESSFFSSWQLSSDVGPLIREVEREQGGFNHVQIRHLHLRGFWLHRTVRHRVRGKGCQGSRRRPPMGCRRYTVTIERV